MFLFGFMSFLIFLSLALKSFHLLTFFITLEMISLITLLGFLMNFFFFFFDLIVILLFLCILACESAVGLVLFVLYSRFFSKDYYISVGVMKF